MSTVLSLSLFFSSCRGGLKLEAAIEKLDVDVSEKVVLDSGLSTGGFTDCLLRYGAAHVYGVDVGYGQVLCIVQNRLFDFFSLNPTLLVSNYMVYCNRLLIKFAMINV